MKITQLVVLIVSYVLVSALIVNSTSGAEPVEIPTLDVPEFDFINVTAGCGGFVDCIEYVGAVIYNIGLTIVAIIQLAFAFVGFIFAISVLIITYGVEGVAGAPAAVNVVIGGYLGITIALAIYRAIRSGKTND